MTDRTGLLLKRRSFLLGSAAVGAGLALAGCDAIGIGARDPVPAGKLGAYIEIFDDGSVAITTPGAEMGQGVASSLPKILAEELGADWETVTTRLSGVDPAFAKPSGRQLSGNSDAVMSYYEPLRKVGAGAREMLVAAAASRWGVEQGDVTVSKGVLTNSNTGDTLSFGDVAEEAAKLPIPENPVLKDPQDFELIGVSGQRKDIPAKVDGTAVFGIDVELPGMLHAAIKHAPVAGASVEQFDASTARGMPGVLKVVNLSDAVAVIAESYWQAQQAVDTIEIADPLGDKVDSDALKDRFRAALDRDQDALPFVLGGRPPDWIESAELPAIKRAIANAPQKLEFNYSVPYLAHATLEPMCATALVKGDSCEFWAPTQAGDSIAPDVTAATGIPEDAITVHRTYLGGGFGRKNDRDFMIQAAKIAQAMPGRPVKMIWSREQDTKHGFHRPAVVVRSKVGLSSSGEVLAVHTRGAGQPLKTSSFKLPGMPSPATFAALIPEHYKFPMSRIDAIDMEEPIKTTFWRAVAGSSSGFFSDSLVDEIAHHTGRDPVEFRLSLMQDNPRGEAVLKLAAGEAGWGSRKGMGVGYWNGWNSHCVHIVEVTVEEKRLTIDKVTTAFDCGLAVDPDNVIAQVESAINFGLSAALFGKLTWRDGKVVESHYGDYPVVTLANAPQIEVHLISSPETIGGVGETGLPPIAPALTNAIFDATGDRIRDLPIVDSGYEVRR